MQNTNNKFINTPPKKVILFHLRRGDLKSVNFWGPNVLFLVMMIYALIYTVLIFRAQMQLYFLSKFKGRSKIMI